MLGIAGRGRIGTTVGRRASTASSWPRVARRSASIPTPRRSSASTVDAGGAEPVEVWCGAFNLAVGDLVPLATVGTVMPDGMEIGRRKIRGE